MEQELKYIYAVYKNGSFSKAARELFITQPALSIAISKVEARIGMPLFDRAAKPLCLTPAGECYIRKYHEIRNLERELTQQLEDLSSLQTGYLRIGASHYWNSYVLPPVLAAFTEKYPQVRLELVEAGAESLLQKLSDREIDLTFNCEAHPSDTFLRTPCFTDTLLLAVPAAFPAAQALRSAALTPEDIRARRHLLPETPAPPLTAFADTPFLLLTPGNDLHTRSHALFEASGVTPVIRMQVNQLATAWHLAAAGLGAAFVTDHLVSGSDAPVVFFRLPAASATRVFDLTMSDRRYVSRAMTAFADILAAHYPMS